jgi:hypothetical protein
LKDKFSEIVPKEQARVKKLKTEHGDLPLGQVTLSMVSAAARQDDLAVLDSILTISPSIRPTEVCAASRVSSLRPPFLTLRRYALS